MWIVWVQGASRGAVFRDAGAARAYAGDLLRRGASTVNMRALPAAPSAGAGERRRLNPRVRLGADGPEVIVGMPGRALVFEGAPLEAGEALRQLERRLARERAPLLRAAAARYRHPGDVLSALEEANPRLGAYFETVAGERSAQLLDYAGEVLGRREAARVRDWRGAILATARRVPGRRWIDWWNAPATRAALEYLAQAPGFEGAINAPAPVAAAAAAASYLDQFEQAIDAGREELARAAARGESVPF